MTGNVSQGNGLDGDGAGIHIQLLGGGHALIADNNVTDNDRGIDVASIGNLIIQNSASGNGTNYVIAASNTVGQIIDHSAEGGVVSDPNPWANFEL